MLNAKSLSAVKWKFWISLINKVLFRIILGLWNIFIAIFCLIWCKCKYFHYAAQFEYKVHRKLDCLVNMDLDSLESNGTPDHNNCMEWCNFNSSCGGFSLYLDTCYFKNNDCENDMTRASGTDLYIKQDRWFIWNIFQSKKKLHNFKQWLKMFWNIWWNLFSIKCSFVQLHTLSIRIRTVFGATTSIEWDS